MKNDSSYNLSSILEGEDFTYIRDIDTGGTKVIGWKNKNPHALAQYHQFLTHKMNQSYGGIINDDIAKVLGIVVDNESGGFRSVRECGIPKTEAQRIRLLDYIWDAERKNSTHYCTDPKAKMLGNKSTPSRELLSLESDGVKFRGGWCIQLTGRGNYAAYGQAAFVMRKSFNIKNDITRKVAFSAEKLVDLNAEYLDVMIKDPLMDLLVMLCFLSRTRKTTDLTFKVLCDKLNTLTPRKLFAMIGYDNNPKHNKNIPSLDTMMARYTSYTIVKRNNVNKTNLKENEITRKTKPTVLSRKIEHVRKFKFDRRLRS